MPSASTSSTRSGFTLIELLIVVVVIGVLASVSVPKYSELRDRAARSSMVSDLRNLASAQEGHFFERNTYSSDSDSLSFRATGGVVVTIVEATDRGWSATAIRTGVAGSTCSVFHGTAAPVGTAGTADRISCE